MCSEYCSVIGNKIITTLNFCINIYSLLQFNDLRILNRIIIDTHFRKDFSEDYDRI